MVDIRWRLQVHNVISRCEQDENSVQNWSEEKHQNCDANDVHFSRLKRSINWPCTWGPISWRCWTDNAVHIKVPQTEWVIQNVNRIFSSVGMKTMETSVYVVHWIVAVLSNFRSVLSRWILFYVSRNEFIICLEEEKFWLGGIMMIFLSLLYRDWIWKENYHIFMFSVLIFQFLCGVRTNIYV